MGDSSSRMTAEQWEGIWAYLVRHPKARQSYATPTEAVRGRDFYYGLLSDIPAPVVGAAVKAVSATATFFPTPAEIRAAAQLLAAPPLVTGLEAWGGVLAAIRAGRPVEDEIAARCVEGLGGLRAIGLTDESDLGTMRAHFIKAYDAHRAHEAQFAGIPEHVRALAAGTQKGALTDGTE